MHTDKAPAEAAAPSADIHFGRRARWWALTSHHNVSTSSSNDMGHVGVDHSGESQVAGVVHILRYRINSNVSAGGRSPPPGGSCSILLRYQRIARCGSTSVIPRTRRLASPWGREPLLPLSSVLSFAPLLASVRHAVFARFSRSTRRSLGLLSMRLQQLVLSSTPKCDEVAHLSWLRRCCCCRGVFNRTVLGALLAVLSEHQCAQEKGRQSPPTRRGKTM